MTPKLKKLIGKGIKKPHKILPYIKNKIIYGLAPHEIGLMYKWKGGWKYFLNQHELIEEPFQVALRGKSPAYYINWKDRAVIEEFYQSDGYDDIEINNFDTIVDVGAHIGLFSIKASEKGKKVYAFEPSSDSYVNFLYNIELHLGNKSNIIPHNTAIGSYNGYCKLTKNEDLSLSDSTMIEESGTTVEVPCLDFSTMLENISLEGETLLKLDCEGAEFEILKTSNSNDFDQIDTVFLEYHGSVGDPEVLTQLLRSYGYTVHQREDPRDFDTYDLGFILAEKNG